MSPSQSQRALSPTFNTADQNSGMVINLAKGPDVRLEERSGKM
jgi:hypothetical protein